jgi:hypothetical protein
MMFKTVVALFSISLVASMPIDIAELEGVPLKMIPFEELNFTDANGATSQKGVDVSTTITSSSASCFASASYTFVVPRVPSSCHL